MTDHNMANAEQLHIQLQRELGIDPNIPVEALNTQDVKAISDVQIVNTDEDDTDPIVAAMTNAVNAPSMGSMPIGTALNNAELDEAMTEYFNRRI